jgi:hypothetical protein
VPLSQINAQTHLYGSINSYTTFFSNRLYIGILEFGDLVIENYCEPIIDQVTWEAVQLRLQQHAAHHNLTDPGSVVHPRRIGSRYLLSGLAFCARCGSPLYGSSTPQRNKSVVNRYACTRAARQRDCDLKPIPRKVLETAVLDTLAVYVLQPEVQAANLQLIQAQQAQAHADLRAQRTDLSNRIGGVRRRLANLTAAIAEAGHTSALLESLNRFEAEVADLRSQIAAIDRQLAAPVPELPAEDLPAQLEALRAVLSDPNHEAAQRLLRGLVNRIVVDRDGSLVRGELIYYSPPP